MGKLLVVEQDIAVQRGFELFARMKLVRLQHLLDAAVEPLDPLPSRRLQAIAERDAVGLRMLRRGQAVVDAKFGAELVEIVLASGAAFAQAEQAVGELLAIVGKNGADAKGAGPFQVAQQATGGQVSEWRSKAIPRYQRLTKTAEALIASVYLAGTNTRRVKGALFALFKGAVSKDARQPRLAQGEGGLGRLVRL